MSPNLFLFLSDMRYCLQYLSVCGGRGRRGSKDNQEISGLVDKAGINRPMVLPVIGDRLLATLNN